MMLVHEISNKMQDEGYETQGSFFFFFLKDFFFFFFRKREGKKGNLRAGPEGGDRRDILLARKKQTEPLKYVGVG